jgi:hypothetical protein
LIDRGSKSVINLKTKIEVIEEGLRELIRKKNRDRLLEELGTFDISLSPGEFEKSRDE